MRQTTPRRAAALAAMFMTGTLLTSAPLSASEPFLGQIEYYAFNFPPRGWALCEGQLLPISQNQSLFALLGITFGGNGTTNFALPDMRGRSPVHDGGSAGPGLSRRILGDKGGAENVTLTPAQLPAHTHVLRANSGAADAVIPTNASLADTAPDQLYSGDPPDTTLHSGSIGATAASSAAHNNMAPYLVVNCSIAMQGIFPSRN